MLIRARTDAAVKPLALVESDAWLGAPAAPRAIEEGEWLI
jgi:hypothetical protein